jgi:ATPase family AAA domain-containing protein 3A/B
MEFINNLFGLGGGDKGAAAGAAANAPAPASPAGGAPAAPSPDKDEKKEETFDGFNPTGLERAAKAAKELDASKNAKEAIKLSTEQEITKRAAIQATMEENKARQKAFEVERVRVQGEEQRKNLQQQQQGEQQNAYYNDQLSRKRNQDQMNAQRAMREHELKRGEESAMRIEQIKRETAQYEASLKKEVEKARVGEEIVGRIRQERENWDLHLQAKRMEAKEFRETVLEGVKEAVTMVGSGFREFLTDYERMGTTVAGLSLLAVGVYTAKNSTSLAARLIEARISKPPLVRETSRLTASDAIVHPIKTLSTVFKSKGNAMKNVVLEPKLHKRLEHLAQATYNTKKNNAPYRHMLLHGPPGTGKTMWAKNLAKASGMDYAVLTGGDVAPLGRDGVTEIHKMFDWASTSRRGLLMFVDESDAFLRKRSNETMSEDLRNALNAFLYRTGESSKNFMIVFASNQPEQLDWAVNDRTDEVVYFALPDQAARERMVSQYFDQMIRNPESAGMFKSSNKIHVDPALDEAKITEAAARIEGFSGREISKLCIAWQSAAFGSADCTLTPELFDDVLEARVEQHMQKHQWEGEQGQRAPVTHVGRN